MERCGERTDQSLRLSEYIMDNLDKIYVFDYASQKTIYLKTGKVLNTVKDDFMRDHSGSFVTRKADVSHKFLKRIDEIYENEKGSWKQHTSIEQIFENFRSLKLQLRGTKMEPNFSFMRTEQIGNSEIYLERNTVKTGHNMALSIQGYDHTFHIIRCMEKQFYYKLYNEKIMPGIDLIIVPEVEDAIYIEGDYYYYIRTFSMSNNEGHRKFEVIRFMKKYYSPIYSIFHRDQMWIDMENQNMDAER